MYFFVVLHCFVRIHRRARILDSFIRCAIFQIFSITLLTFISLNIGMKSCKGFAPLIAITQNQTLWDRVSLNAHDSLRMAKSVCYYLWVVCVLTIAVKSRSTIFKSCFSCTYGLLLWLERSLAIPQPQIVFIIQS